MNKSKVLLNITSFVCFVFFALYIFTLVFIPIGIYCYIAGKNFAYKAEHLDDKMKMSDHQFKAYTIFVSIFCFPLGLLAILPYKFLTSNNVVVTDLKYVNTEEESKVEEVKTVETSTTNSEVVESPVEEKAETEEEKIEKFRKLENFKEKGFITEEELEQAREQIFGKKE